MRERKGQSIDKNSFKKVIQFIPQKETYKPPNLSTILFQKNHLE